MSFEYNIQLAKKRLPNEMIEIRKIWNELGTNLTDKDFKKYRPVYTVTEFLEFILTIKCRNFTDIISQSITGLINIGLEIKNLKDIKQQYEHLTIDFFQSGLDQNLNSIIESERYKTGIKIVEVNDLLLAREFSKQGCTVSLRAKLWCQMLNVYLTPIVSII
jgi:hypothetical protein